MLGVTIARLAICAGIGTGFDLRRNCDHGQTIGHGCIAYSSLLHRCTERGFTSNPPYCLVLRVAACVNRILLRTIRSITGTYDG